MFFKPEGLQLNLKETLTQMFSCEYDKIFKNSIFYRTLSLAAFVVNGYKALLLTSNSYFQYGFQFNKYFSFVKGLQTFLN